MSRAIWVGLAIAAVACAKTVPQDLKTGEDGRSKGAQEMTLENGEAKAHGIVTYPGGDRVDWKVLQLPKDQVGQLDFKLRWKPPRPGLDLSFQIYNEWGRLLEEAKPITRKNSRRTNKSISLPNVKGKLLIAVYASGRGDAGAYTLTADWKPLIVDEFDWLKVEVMDPPKLQAVPEPVKPCDLNQFDKANPDCQNKCPMAFDPTWPGCAGVCPTPPDPKIPACKLCNKDAMDPCLADCKQYYPECDPAKPDPKNPNCDGFEPRPQAGEVTDLKSLADGTQVTINLGTENGVDKTWVGDLLDPAGNKLTGSFKLISVGKRASVGKTSNAAVPQGATIVLKPKPGPPMKACKR